MSNQDQNNTSEGLIKSTQGDDVFDEKKNVTKNPEDDDNQKGLEEQFKAQKQEEEKRQLEAQEKEKRQLEAQEEEKRQKEAQEEEKRQKEEQKSILMRKLIIPEYVNAKSKNAIDFIKDNWDKIPKNELIGFLELQNNMSENTENYEEFFNRIIKNYTTNLKDEYTIDLIKIYCQIIHESNLVFHDLQKNQNEYTKIEISIYSEAVKKERKKIEGIISKIETTSEKNVSKIKEINEEINSKIEGFSEVFKNKIEEAHNIPLKKMENIREKIQNEYKTLREEINKNNIELSEYTQSIKSALNQNKTLKNKVEKITQLKAFIKPIGIGLSVGVVISTIIFLNILNKDAKTQNIETLQNFVSEQNNIIKTLPFKGKKENYNVLKINNVYPYDEVNAMKNNTMYYDPKKNEVFIVKKK